MLDKFIWQPKCSVFSLVHYYLKVPFQFKYVHIQAMKISMAGIGHFEKVK